MLERLKRTVLGAFRGNNKYYRAFLQFLGDGFTFYDLNNSNYLSKGFLYNPDVYAVVQQQATKHASVPISIKRVKNKSAKRKLDMFNMQTKGIALPSQIMRKAALTDQAFEEEELEIPLEKPNPIQTWAGFRSLEKTYLKTTGNIFYYVQSPSEGANTGIPKQIYILPSHLVQIIVKSNAAMLEDTESPIKEYLLLEGDQFIRFEAENVVHVKYENPDFDMNGSHLYGLSPLRAALRNIQSSNEAITNNIKTLQNSGAFGFLHGKGNVLTESQAKELKDRLQEMDVSDQRFGKIAGVSSEIGFTKVGLSTDELKPFDYIKNDQKAICNVLGWSDNLLNNDEGGKYDRQKEERKRVVTDNIMPDNNLINYAYTEIFKKFQGYEDVSVESVYDDLPELQEDLGAQMDWVGQAVDKGIIHRKHAQAVLKLPEDDNPMLEVYTVNADILTLEEAIENFTIDDNGQET